LKKLLVVGYCLLVIAMSGCSVKNYESSQSKVITFKTKQFQYSDVGFVKKTKQDISLQVFHIGNPILDIVISKNVCINGKCLTPTLFNQKVLSKHYPANLFKNLIQSRPIFEGLGLVKNQAGFKQIIKSNDVDISYLVNDKQTYFKDKKNKILFKLRNAN
jgi:hypothetical protein